MLTILALLFAVMLAVDRPKEGLGGLMPISDTEIMAQHLNGLSDEELSSGKKLLNQLKDLIALEQRQRAVIPLKEHNKRWMERHGEFFQQLKDAVDTHLRTRNGSFFEELDWNRDAFGDIEVESSDSDDEVMQELKKSYRDIVEKAKWFEDKSPRYRIKHFLKTGEKKYMSIDVNKMLGIKGKTDRCPFCWKETLYQSDYEASWQEMPGAPVQSAYYTYSCGCCGFQFYQRGSLSENVCGVDLAGQPLHANMTTEEVASMYDDGYY